MGIISLSLQLWFLATSLTFLGSAAGQQCSQFGVRGNRRRSSRIQTEHLFLNTANPADCWGTISSFSFCYYAPNIHENSNDRYVANFGVYRPSVVDGTTVYTLVSGVLVAQRTQSQVDNDLDFEGDDDDEVEYDDNDNCVTNINLAEPVTVEVGDVFGACVFDPPDNDLHRLDIIRSTSSSRDVLKRVSTAGCGDASVPLTVDTFEADVRGRMHLYADIEPLPATDPPTVPPTTTEATTMPPTTTEATTMPPTTTEATNMPPTTIPTNDPTTETTTTVTATVEATTQTATTNNTQNPLTFGTQAPTTSAAMDRDSTTIDSSVDSTTSAVSTSVTDSEFVSSGDSGNLAVIVAPIVLVLLTAAVVFGLVMLFAWRRYRKKNIRQIRRNIQGHPTTGFENMLYGDYLKSTDNKDLGLYSGYDEIVTHTDLSSEHVYEEEYEFPAAAPQRRLSNVYAEVGPFHEDHTIEVHYESPLDAQAVKFSELLKKNKERDIYDHISPYQVPATKERELYGQLKSWGTRSIPRNEIEVTGHLGSGQFGSVEQGVWKRQGTKPVDVALKSLTKTSEEDKVKFLQEAAIMAQFRHSNVILLHGIVIQGKQTLIVIEFAARGDLKGYLQTSRQNPGISVRTPKLLLKFSQQVALGMQYLSAKGFIHRDLAARNVLVTSDDTCKIADFGMSRDLADETYYISHGGKIPVKWTAPEAIHYNKYSTASDVWAYGCLIYEIWSLGHKPFEGIRNLDVVKLVDAGKRLSPPPGCPKMIYELMITCWHPQKDARPAFRDIVLTLVGSEEMVLNIPEEDSSTSPLAGVLGAPLEAGENMYSEVHRRYRV